jgi:hypothetical protein
MVRGVEVFSRLGQEHATQLAKIIFLATMRKLAQTADKFSQFACRGIQIANLLKLPLLIPTMAFCVPIA